MPLAFVTISLRDSEVSKSHSACKKFYKKYSDDIRMFVKEYGSNDSHLHFHSLCDIPPGIIGHAGRLADLLGCKDNAHGIKIVAVNSSKKEMYYVGYMQKEIKQAGMVNIFKDRVLKCNYGKKYMDKAWTLYQQEKGSHKNWSQKLSYDGTILANEIIRRYEIKGYDQALYAVLEYSKEHNVDVRRPETIANLINMIQRMEKQKNRPLKKVL